MNCLSEIDVLRSSLNSLAERHSGVMTLMEVCGTHTVAIFRSGLRSLLPHNIRLISGPGCPVCVTDQTEIDMALDLCRQSNISVFTYGDMIRVPGRGGSLKDAMLAGADVHVVLSPMELLKAAAEEKKRQCVFLAVGFETTSAQTALLVKEAQRRNLSNISVLVLHKTVVPALELLAADQDVGVDGFLLPGHVSTIIGMEPYHVLPDRWGIGGVISGFEGQDLLMAVTALVMQIVEKTPKIVNAYPRAVRPDGNPVARALINQCFEPCDTMWRGLGCIPLSGLKLRDGFTQFDAKDRFGLTVPVSAELNGCRCGDVLRGRIDPPLCPLFAKVCTPVNPVGPCMVSSEGSCGAWFRYGRNGGTL